MDVDPSKKKDYFAERPDYEARDDHPVDSLLYLDPVLVKLAETDDGLQMKLRAIQGAKQMPDLDPSVESTLLHILHQSARDDLLFPYNQDPVLLQAALTNDELRESLRKFAEARSTWKQNPDDPVLTQTYLDSAEAVQSSEEFERASESYMSE